VQYKLIHIIVTFAIFFTLPIAIYANDWQQQVNYDIDVTLHETTSTLQGFISIDYTNNSPDTLKEIYFHLWPNAYKHKHTPLAKQMMKLGRTDFFYAKDDELGYIDGLNFKQESSDILTEYFDATPDIAKVRLSKPLLPGASTNISTPFVVKLPKIISRSGYDGNGLFAVTQWYPKPAVYDKQGWHPMSYLVLGEFYSEFGNFNVTLHIPRKGQVAATGVCRNVVEDMWQQSRADLSTQIVEGVVLADSIKKMPYPDTSLYKTLIYTAENVHDFAWFFSRGMLYAYDYDTLPNGNVVKVQSYSFSPSALQSSLLSAKNSLDFFNKKIGYYPYSQLSVIEMPISFAGGMEYPMIGTFSSSSGAMMDIEIAHEVGHNWWYGILASNERKEPFLDEGINSYYEIKYSEQDNTSNVIHSALINIAESILGTHYIPNEKMRRLSIIYQQRLNAQQSIDEKSDELSNMNYYTSLYAKGALAMKYLEAYLSEEKLDEAIHNFFHQYAFKHYALEDLKNSLEHSTGKDLSWFFDDYLHQEVPDKVGIKELKKLDEYTYNLTLRNPYHYPVQVALIDNGGDTIMVNNGGFFKDSIQFLHKEPFKKIIIDPYWHTQDNYRTDNSIKAKGLLKKLAPMQIRPLGAIENINKNQLFFAPFMGGNAYDKFMLGMSIYNRLLPAKNFDYLITPMYAFGSKQFNWDAQADYYFTPNSKRVRQIRLGLSSRSYSIQAEPKVEKMYKLQGHISVDLQKKELTLWKQQVQLRNVTIWRNDAYVDVFEQENSYNVWELLHAAKFEQKLFPFSSQVRAQFNKRFGRLLMSSDLGIKYGKLHGYFRLRLFAAAMLYKSNDLRFAYNKQHTLTLQAENGTTDMLYDHIYLGRYETEGLWSKQIFNDMGGFRTITPLLQSWQNGQTVNGLITITGTADFPLKYVPLKLFFGMGYYSDKQLQFTHPKGFLGEMGACIALWDDVLQINFPFLYSKSFRDDFVSNNYKFKNKISFSMNLAKLHIFNRIREAKPLSF
jgi:hypothetical protein